MWKMEAFISKITLSVYFGEKWFQSSFPKKKTVTGATQATTFISEGNM